MRRLDAAELARIKDFESRRVLLHTWTLAQRQEAFARARRAFRHNAQSGESSPMASNPVCLSEKDIAIERMRSRQILCGLTV